METHNGNKEWEEREGDEGRDIPWLLYSDPQLMHKDKRRYRPLVSLLVCDKREEM